MDPGTLYVVATPIGNLNDLSARAASALRHVDIVAAEDTRTARVLFEQYGIQTPTRSYHDYNKESVTPDLTRRLQEGESVALISEAGTPGISDPGFYMVREAHRMNIPVIAVPGPCAAVAALSASGLPSDRFYYLGFLPRGQAMHERLHEAGLLDATLIIYESPERISGTLSVLAEVLGERTICLSREMTKVHEEHLTGTPESLLQHLRDNGVSVRGEITLVVAPAGFDLHKKPDTVQLETRVEDEAVLEQVNLLVGSGYRLAQAARIVARGHELPRSDVYRQYLRHYRGSG